MPGLHHRMRRAVAGAGGVYTAKSFLVDVFDQPTFNGVNIRQLDFYFEGNKLGYADGVDGVAHALFPEVNTLVKYMFNTNTSYTGSQTVNCWQQISLNNTVRIALVFTNPITFDSIIINNAHNSGGLVERGAEALDMYVTPDEDSGTVAEAEVPNGTLIFNDEIRQHVASDVRDDQILTLIG